jgi:hypothetical protein
MNTPDDYALLSAIWILACNDENNLITYKGIQHRLGLPKDYDVRGLVVQHGELFRQGMPASKLEEWKEDMRHGKRRPAFIRRAESDELRNRLIDTLQPSDGFRSQFRAETNAPRSEVVVIEWGLGHVERLRKAHYEARDATAKSWQIWLVFAASLLGVAATIIAALLKK